MEEELKEIKELALNNAKAIQENKDNIDKNFEKIQQNAYGLDILRDYKETSKKLYILVLLLTIAIIVLGLHHLLGC